MNIDLVRRAHLPARVAAIIDDVIDREGDFVDHPSDRGGPTRWGITERRARAEGYTGRMEDLPVEIAFSIYARRYVTDPGFIRVVPINETLAAEVIDTGVVMGPARAAEFLQRWLNGFNSEDRYADLFVDARVGPLTAETLSAFLAWRGDVGRRVLLCALNCTQGDHFLAFAEARRDQRDFLFGWVRKRVLEQMP